MRVLLIRHGEAIDPRSGPDGSRHLTRRGREVSRAVARALEGRGVVPTVIYTSPLVRAVQTAEILAHAIDHRDPVLVHDHLVPNATTARALAVLDLHDDDDIVALISHEPTVHTLAGHLTGLGGGFPGFRTSGAAVIDLAGGVGQLVGRLDPSTMAWRAPSDLRP